jgi:hypothetical protein
MSEKPTCYGRHVKGDGSWWLEDNRGIPVGRVCDKCIAAREAAYAPAFSPQYDVEETIEPEDY